MVPFDPPMITVTIYSSIDQIVSEMVMIPTMVAVAY